MYVRALYFSSFNEWHEDTQIEPVYTDPLKRGAVVNSGGTITQIEALGFTDVSQSIWKTNASGYIQLDPVELDPNFRTTKPPDQSLTQGLEYDAYNDLYINILRRATKAPFYIEDFEENICCQKGLANGAVLSTGSATSRSGSRSLRLVSNGSGFPMYTTPSFDSTNYKHVIIEIWFYAMGPITKESLTLECMRSVGNGAIISPIGGEGDSWTLFDDYNSLKTFVYVVTECNVTTVDEATIQLRYESKNSQTSIFVDDIQITGLEPAPVTVFTRSEICPVNRTYPSEKFLISPYADANLSDGVDDDLSEISSLAFTTLTDAENNLYAYVVSDKNQFSLKVIKFARSKTAPGQYLTGTATTVAAYTLGVDSSVQNDWEDISLGPCMDDGNEDGVCIYVGNFGNNARGGGYDQRLNALEIFKFPEPDFPPVDRTIPVATIKYNYKSSFGNPNRTFDAEAMFVDWTGDSGDGKGDIYIVVKGKCGEGVGRILGSQHRNLAYDGNGIVDVGSIDGVMRDPPWQGTYNCSATSRRFQEWQGADMSRNGRTIAMIVGQSPSRVHFFPRATGQSVEDALSGPTPSFDGAGNNLGGPGAACDYVSATSYGLVNEKQWEAVAFVDYDGTKFAEVSECNGGGSCNVPVYMHELLFEEVVDASPSDGGWKKITFDNFEDGTFGNYTNGQDAAGAGSECPSQQICTSLKNIETRSCGSGTWSVELRQDNGMSSSIFHKLDQDCRSYPWIRVTFDFRPFKYEYMDTLFLEVSLDSGNNYYIVADWSFEIGTILVDRQCVTETVSLKASDFEGRGVFGRNVRLRFRASTDSLDDFGYIDNILFEGHSSPIML
jgi:hypothetical protein